MYYNMSNTIIKLHVEINIYALHIIQTRELCFA